MTPCHGELARPLPLRWSRRIPDASGFVFSFQQFLPFIDGVHRRPAWSPPQAVKRDKPSLPDVIPGGSPRNPMGEAALTLNGGEYAIHGTNVPGSVGGFVSYGCIRMLNDDISDLYQRVSVGTTVTVTR